MADIMWFASIFAVMFVVGSIGSLFFVWLTRSRFGNQFWSGPLIAASAFALAAIWFAYMLFAMDRILD